MKKSTSRILIGSLAMACMLVAALLYFVDQAFDQLNGELVTYPTETVEIKLRNGGKLISENTTTVDTGFMGDSWTNSEYYYQAEKSSHRDHIGSGYGSLSINDYSSESDVAFSQRLSNKS